jgi:hypothetical protein
MNQNDSDVTCPTCQSLQVERRLSLFASVNKERNSSAALAADAGESCCSGGMCGCSLN